MSYVCVIRNNKIMNKSEKFDKELQELARFARVISHPARLAILKFLAESKTCISGDISEYLPLSRTTVSQHLKELRDLGLIHGTIDGLKINYCLCGSSIRKNIDLFEDFFATINSEENSCSDKVC
jgi:ArsR family transcriptional regulator, arsenate/arsenite/antimonite-responsive transcriptional repressor